VEGTREGRGGRRPGIWEAWAVEVTTVLLGDNRQREYIGIVVYIGTFNPRGTDRHQWEASIEGRAGGEGALKQEPGLVPGQFFSQRRRNAGRHCLVPKDNYYMRETLDAGARWGCTHMQLHQNRWGVRVGPCNGHVHHPAWTRHRTLSGRLFPRAEKDTFDGVLPKLQARLGKAEVDFLFAQCSEPSGQIPVPAVTTPLPASPISSGLPPCWEFGTGLGGVARWG